MQGITQQINSIPYTDYIEIMNTRQYDIKKIIEYTSMVYRIDIQTIENYSKNINNNIYGENIYEDFINADEQLKYKSASRKDFNSYVRPQYIKFVNQYFHPKNDIKLDDMLIPNQIKANVIHHIHPLIFGGTNSIYNLLPITDFNHKLLHMNPYENNIRTCYQAVDMLSYLYSKPMLKLLHKKYFTKKVKDKGLRFENKYWQIIFEEEMQKFYNNNIC